MGRKVFSAGATEGDVSFEKSGLPSGSRGKGAAAAAVSAAPPISVISIPMILDRPVDAVTAGLCSLRLVLTQGPVMLLWGGLITGLVVLAMLPGFLGLLLVGPVLGHASWHAYRAALGPAPAA